MPTNGEIIRRVRKSRGIKRQPFAASIKISSPTLDRLERDDPRIDPATVARAAAALGLKFDGEAGVVIAPPHLPPDRQRQRPTRSLRLAADVLAGLEYFAGKRKPKQTVAEYLAEHVRARGYKLTISPLPPSPGRLPSEASPAGHTHE